MRKTIPAIALALTSLALLSQGTQAQAIANLPPQIVVSGEGEVSATPDIAMLSFAVVREGDTAKVALSASSAAMHEVLASLKGVGIADKDMQTSGLNIQPRYAQPAPGRPHEPKITGYAVSNQLTVKVRRPADPGEILDKVVGLGVNQGGGITFSVDDPRPLIREARKKAVADAMEKARALADAAGIKLGRITAISESSQGRHPPMPYARAEMAMSAKAIPVAAGESTYTAQVNMTFEIAP